MVGADGTTAQTTRTGAGTTASPYVTTVTVLRPGPAPVFINITGEAIAEPVLAADGTHYHATRTGEAPRAVPRS